MRCTLVTLLIGSAWMISTHPVSAQTPFGSSRHFLTRGTYLNGMRTGDFNEDDHLDVVTLEDTGNNPPHVAGLFVGDGAGHFSHHVLFSIAVGAAGPCVNDFDGDGHLDLAFLLRTCTTTCQQTFVDLLIALGDGHGAFTLLPLLRLGPHTLGELTAGDWNEDGIVDLAVTYWTEGVMSIALGNGDGTFRSTTYPLPFTAGACAGADLDGDGHPDLVISYSDPFAPAIALVRGVGDGTFLPPEIHPIGVGGDVPTAIFFEDFDRDGFLDVGASADRRFAIFRNDGHGSLEPPRLTGETSAFLGATGDFDEDGFPDVVTGRTPFDETFVFLNDGAGFLVHFGQYPSARDTSCVTVGDFDEDGHLDVVWGGSQGQDIALLLGDGRGHFPGPIVVPRAGSSGSYGIADFNEDGIDDLLHIDSSGDLQFLQGRRGVGLTVPETRLHVGRPGWRGLVGDFDEDGHLDFICTTVRADGSAIGFQVCLGDGHGVFRLGPLHPSDVTHGTYDSADLDGDGHLDIVAGGFVGPLPTLAFKTLLGDGTGHFTDAASLVTSSHGARQTGFTDVNGDGYIDFVAMLYEQAVAFLGDGRGGFAGTQSLPALGNPSGMAMADFNGDGLLDMAIGHDGRPWGIDVSLRRSPTFLQIVQTLPTYGTNLISAGDVDGDGDIDLVGGGGNDFFQIFWNDGTGHFTTDGELIGTGLTGGGVLADFDGDGDLDVFVQYADPKFGIIPNLLMESRARTGTVNAGRGPIADVLRVNGSAGDSERRLRVLVHEPVTLSIDAPPAGPSAARFILCAMPGEPTSQSLTTLPFGIGTIAMRVPGLSRDAGRTRLVLSSAGRDGRTGTPLLPSSPAPFVRTLPGADAPTTFTLQGIIEDAGSAGSVTASVTNGLVLKLVRR
ncbi:MAG: VCBS repeat-containing protein [Planctomycetes bacterium]|nr:VCBS repeat-containing protein [Planctomycetota bacterium]MBI3847201.1 VCBS repeat-containing protein [Planctomycetota bacterium]